MDEQQKLENALAFIRSAMVQLNIMLRSDYIPALGELMDLVRKLESAIGFIRLTNSRIL